MFERWYPLIISLLFFLRKNVGAHVRLNESDALAKPGCINQQNTHTRIR